MGRYEEYDDELLMALLMEIDEKYGNLTIESLKKAHIEFPEKFPSYKTFERRLGGIKISRLRPELMKE